MPKTAPLKTALSPGQTGSHVVASRHKLNLRRGLRWVVKRTRKVSSQAHTSRRKKHSQFSKQRAIYMSCILLDVNNEWTSLNLR